MVSAYFTTVLLVNIYFFIVYVLSVAMSKTIGRINYQVYEYGSPLFYMFIAPGVVIHETSHAIACLIFGLKIYEFKPLGFYKRRGKIYFGYVSREQSNSAVINALVSLAPLFFSFLILVIISIIPFTHAILSPLWRLFNRLIYINVTGNLIEPILISGSIFVLLPMLVLSTPLINPIFWIIPFLSMVITISARPSEEDLKHAFEGFKVILVINLIILFISLITPFIVIFLYGVYEFFLIFLSLVLSLIMMGWLFLGMLYLTFRISGPFKITPYLITLLVYLLISNYLTVLLSNLASIALLIIQLITLFVYSSRTK